MDQSSSRLPWQPSLCSNCDSRDTADASIRSRIDHLSSHVRVIVVVEGHHDIAFLRGLSQRLLSDHQHVADLQAMERSNQLIFLPTGGGDLWAWRNRLAPLGRPEIHLYDREQSPETELRQQVVDAVNRRPNCLAMLTSKRSLENYLHPQAIFEASKIQVSFGDDDDVAAEFARKQWQLDSPPVSWDELTSRARKRLANRAKRILNIRAVQHMTSDLLKERDPKGELGAWLRMIHDCTVRDDR